MSVPVPSLFWLNRESKQSRPPRPAPGREWSREHQGRCQHGLGRQEAPGRVITMRKDRRSRKSQCAVQRAELGPGRLRAWRPGHARGCPAGFGKGRVRTCRAGSSPHHPPAQKSQGGARHLLLWRNGSAGAWPLQRETRCGAFGPRRPPAREDPGSQAVTDVRREPGGSFQRTGVANRAAASCTSR